METFGLDVAAQSLDVVAASGGRPRRFPNSPTGHTALLAWLRAQAPAGPVQVALEATGTYHRPVAQALHAAGVRVIVCNPLQVARYAQAGLQRTKTDAVDAHLLAQFGARHPELPGWQPPTPEEAHLQLLARTRADLRDQLQQLRNRQHAASYTADAAWLAEVQAPLIAALEQQLRRLEREVAALAQAPTPLGEHLRHLASIPGLGLVTAAVLLAELPLERLDRRQAVAACAGLCPRERRSGTSVRGQAGIGGYGSAALRRALYLPALVAWKWNPVLHAFAERLLARGKPKKLILGALMRKLVELAWTLVRTHQPFSVERAHAPLAA